MCIIGWHFYLYVSIGDVIIRQCGRLICISIQASPPIAPFIDVRRQELHACNLLKSRSTLTAG